MKSVLFVIGLVALATLVYADNDVVIDGSFSATSLSVSWQSVSFENARVGDNLTNMISDLSFVVVVPAGVTVSCGGVSCSVGSIVSGATGWGRFSVVALFDGVYDMTVIATYQVVGSSDWVYAVKSFALYVGESKRAAAVVVSKLSNDDFQGAGIQTRSTNDDMSITPSYFTAPDDTNTWEYFNINANPVNNLYNLTWTVTPDDTSVIIEYPPTGNFVASIPRNTSWTVDFAAFADTGNYNLNISIRYIKGVSGTVYRTWWTVIPLYVAAGATSSSFRMGSAKATSIVAGNGQNMIRVDVAVGIAVGGIALVAAIAVVSAMVILRKKQPTTSV